MLDFLHLFLELLPFFLEVVIIARHVCQVPDVPAAAASEEQFRPEAHPLAQGQLAIYTAHDVEARHLVLVRLVAVLVVLVDGVGPIVLFRHIIILPCSGCPYVFIAVPAWCDGGAVDARPHAEAQIGIDEIGGFCANHGADAPLDAARSAYGFYLVGHSASAYHEAHACLQREE